MSSAAAIEAGLALKASSMRSIVQPSSPLSSSSVSRVPRPEGGRQPARSAIATALSQPSCHATASTASALSAKCRPATPTLNTSGVRHARAWATVTAACSSVRNRR